MISIQPWIVHVNSQSDGEYHGCAIAYDEDHDHGLVLVIADHDGLGRWEFLETVMFNQLVPVGTGVERIETVEAPLVQ